MTPVKFKEVNNIYSGENYLELPAFIENGPNGGEEAITCWSLSLKERLTILLQGKIWVCLLTKSKRMPPMFLTTKKTEIIK